MNTEKESNKILFIDVVNDTLATQEFHKPLKDYWTNIKGRLVGASKGAVKNGLAKTEREADFLVDEFLEKCCKKTFSLRKAVGFGIDLYGLTYLAEWVFTNYGSWQFLVEDRIGDEVEAILSGACALCSNNEYGIAFGEITFDRIVERWEKQIKPIQSKIHFEERRIARIENSLVAPNRQEAGLFAVNVDNEVITKLFPTKGKKGIFSITLGEKKLGQCYLKEALEPIDISVFASLISSITQNTAKDKYGNEYYYITQRAFCKAFFGIDKNSGVGETELEIIDEAVYRLVNARYMNINISKKDTSMKIEFPLNGQAEADILNENEDLDEPTILAHPRYLPIYEYERDLPTLVNKAPAWVIKKEDFAQSPIIGLAREINRFYIPCARLIPRGVKKTKSFIYAFYSILNEKILKWYERQTNGAEIDLDSYNPIVDETNDPSRKAYNKQKRNLKNALIATLTHLEGIEEEGGGECELCVFKIGTKTKAGSLRYGKTLKENERAKTKANIRYLKLVKVDRSRWEKVALEEATEKENAETEKN